MSSQIVSCPECGRNKRTLYAYEGEEICDDCRHYKLINDVLGGNLDEEEVRAVAMEKPVFTNRTPSMYVFNSAVLVVHWVWERRGELSNATDSENRGVRLRLIEKMLDEYSADFRDEVLPTLQDAEIVGEVFTEDGDEYFAIGDRYEEVAQAYEDGEENVSTKVQSLAGIVTSEVLAGSDERSSLEAAFFEAVLDNTVTNDGDVDSSREVRERTGTLICGECDHTLPEGRREDMKEHLIYEHDLSPSEASGSIIEEKEVQGYEITEEELMQYADKYNVRRDRFISKLHECLDHGYLFAAPRSSTRTDDDGDIVRYWTIKEEWTKTCAKVKTLAKEYEKELEQTK